MMLNSTGPPYNYLMFLRSNLAFLEDCFLRKRTQEIKKLNYSLQRWYLKQKQSKYHKTWWHIKNFWFTISSAIVLQSLIVIMDNFLLSILPAESDFVFCLFIWLMGPEYHSCLDKPSDDGLGKASAERLTTGPAKCS